jgi:hypothetical protein
MLLSRGDRCPEEVLKAHKAHGGQTSFSWGCVDLSDETFPIQVEKPSGCVVCGGTLTGVNFTIPEGVMCDFCDGDKTWNKDDFEQKMKALKKREE